MDLKTQNCLSLSLGTKNQTLYAMIMGCIPIKDICKQIPPLPPSQHHAEKFLICVWLGCPPPAGVRMLGCGVHPPQGLDNGLLYPPPQGFSAYIYPYLGIYRQVVMQC